MKSTSTKIEVNYDAAHIGAANCCRSMTTSRHRDSAEVNLPHRMTNLAFLQPFKVFKFPLDVLNGERAKLLWLIKLRWLAIGLFFLLFVPALGFEYLSRTSASAYLGIVGLLILFNLFTYLHLSEIRSIIRPITLCYQMAFDLLMLTVLLWLTGGLANPFVVLLFLSVGLGSFLIIGRLGIPFMLLAHALLFSLQVSFVKGLATEAMPGSVATFVSYHILLLGFWLVFRMLGASVENQHALAMQSLLRLERSDRLRSIGALAAGFSHEFASPLNVAKIRLERLRRGDSCGEDLQVALRAVGVCENVLRQMNASQLDPREFQFSKVSLPAFVRELVERWRFETGFASVEVKADADFDANVPTVNLAQVLLNLLDNAWDANARGPIVVKLEKRSGEIRLSVFDEGEGFKPEVLARKGEPFLTTKPQGTGLGLYVTEMFVQSLGGRLELENRSEKGAAVHLMWPSPDL